MLVKIYWTIWAVFAFISVLLLATGSFTMLTAVAVGFFAFGLTFMGMMGVLPAMVAHPAPEPLAKAEPSPQIGKTAPARSLGVLKSA